MELSEETENYIRESIDDSLGLEVSTDTLLRKLRAVETSNLHLHRQYLSLHSKLKEKDEIIERSRAEASMNAMALKKFVEENQKLATECSNLLAACSNWERECSLYDQDREALMDFANEADERAKEAEVRNRALEEERKRLVEELSFYKFQSEGQSVNVCADELNVEQVLLDSLLTTLFEKDDTIPAAHTFLEAHSGLDVCQQLLKMWNSLRPLNQKVVALAAQAKRLEKDKDHLTTNLLRAEEEVNALFEENSMLDKENKKLMRQCYREKHGCGSGGGSVSGKGKRKSSPRTCSPVEKKIDFGDMNTLREPLSPLQYNSPESRIHKK
ncbi:protein kinase superfamily protein [Striga asiatica]|uniref:Protein kinase superfamily protein n=1 Tax=Striga asiatica TaxID=4170 RepID=A0A5A7QIC8_STRAF|nr:protein kinase superfamily protein [Striga asiatica]